MSVRHRSWLFPCLLAGALGCHPDVEGLTEARAYDEALCGATYYSRHPDRDLPVVAAALDRDARPRLHLATISPVELEAAYGDVGRRFSEQAVLVRGTTAIDQVGVEDFGLSLTLTGPTGPILEHPPSRELLASYTGEAFPAGEVIERRSRRRLVQARWQKRPLMGWVAGALEASTLFIVPVTVITGHSTYDPGGTSVIPPSEDEVAAAVPVATSLARAAEEQSYMRSELGLETAEVFVWDRPADETAPLALVVEWAYATGNCTPRGAQLKRSYTRTAHVTRSVRIPLPPGPTLEARIAAAFGDRVQPLVGATRGR